MAIQRGGAFLRVLKLIPLSSSTDIPIQKIRSPSKVCLRNQLTTRATTYKHMSATAATPKEFIFIYPVSNDCVRRVKSLLNLSRQLLSGFAIAGCCSGPGPITVWWRARLRRWT